MAITRTGVVISTNTTFGDSDDMDFYINGGQLGINQVPVSGLTPDTVYYAKGYVQQDGNTITDPSYMAFRTLGIPIGDNFRITNEYNGANTISLTRDGLQTANISLDYSTDNGATWTHWDSTDGNLSVPLSAGGSVLLKGDNQRFSDASLDAKWHFDSDHEFSVSGNLMSLLDSSRARTDVPSYTFSHLFMATKINGIQSGLLPATELSMFCYTYMFAGCQNLTTIPLDLLPATDLYGAGGNSEAINCYEWMFTGCRNLTNCPNLPATDLSMYCYKDMFMGCTSLVHPMEVLQADSIPNFAYESMFSGCTSLVCSPDIKATTFSGNAMHNMFTNCSSLCEITVHIQNWDTNCTGDWVDGVAATGLLFNLGGATIPTGTSGIPSGWNVITQNYFRIKNLSGSANIITLSNINGSTRTLEYSTDGSTWSSWTSTNGDLTVSLGGYEDVLIRGNNTGICHDGGGYRFSSVSDISAAGNIMSMLDKTLASVTIPNMYCFAQLFYQCTTLKSIASLELPATSLKSKCYIEMFYGCTGITSLPKNFLPATTTASTCYRAMFAMCSNLKYIPESWLLATTLEESCCYQMFAGCTSLTQVTIPDATTSFSCLSSAFSGCSNLCKVVSYMTNWDGSHTLRWLNNVAATGDFYNIGRATIPSGANGIPTGWTEHTSL